MQPTVVIRSLDIQRACDYVTAMSRALAILLSFFILTMQTVTAAHATEYGDGPHEHHGTECLIAKAGDRHDDDWDVPPEVVLLILPRFEAATCSFVQKALLIPTVTVTPPGRAPPLS